MGDSADALRFLVKNSRAIPAFANLDNASLYEISKVMQRRVAKKGDNIVIEGAAGDDFFLVGDGRFEALQGGVRVKELTKGGFFGEGCLKAPTSHRANDPERPLRGASIISQGGTGCLRITRDAFLYAVESDKDVLKPQGGADAA